MFKDNEIIILLDVDNNYWFSGLAIGNILEYNNIHRAIKIHIPSKYRKYYADLFDDKKLHGQTIFISEPGLYRLIMRSKQENAIKFQEWITDIVIPELRKSGKRR